MPRLNRLYACTRSYISSSTRVLSSLRYGVRGRAIATPAKKKEPNPKARRKQRRLSRPVVEKRRGGLAQGPVVQSDGLAWPCRPLECGGTTSAVSSQFSSRQAPAAIPATRSSLSSWSCGGLLDPWRQMGEQPHSDRMKFPHHITIERAARGYFIHQRHRQRAERCQRPCQGCRRRPGLQRVGGHRFAAQRPNPQGSGFAVLAPVAVDSSPGRTA